MGLLALVLVETRYVGSFLTIFGLICFGAIRLVPSAPIKRVTMGLALAIAGLNLFGLRITDFTRCNSSDSRA
jgi:hypothetical protein